MASETSGLTHLLEELALTLELAPPPPIEKKIPTSMQITPLHTVFFSQLQSGFTMWSQIGECPSKNREDFFLLMMRANFLGQGTGKSVIGMDQEEKYLTLSSYIPYEMEFKKFKETVEDFVNFIDYWKEELARHSAQAEEGLF